MTLKKQEHMVQQGKQLLFTMLHFLAMETFEVDLFSPQKMFLDKKTTNFKILMCVDVKSKYLFAEIVKDKKATTVSIAFKKIINKIRNFQNTFPTRTHLLRVFSDAGTEFVNSIFKNLLETNDAQHIIMYGPNKAFHVERIIRTISGYLAAQYFSETKFDLFKVLNKTIDMYNYKTNLHDDKSPIQRIYDEDNPTYLHKFKNLNFKHEQKNMVKLKKKYLKIYPIGSKVRIETEKLSFSKSSTDEKWSAELFVVKSIKMPILSIWEPRFRLRDLSGESIKGLFNINELKPISKK